MDWREDRRGTLAHGEHVRVLLHANAAEHKLGYRVCVAGTSMTEWTLEYFMRQGYTFFYRDVLNN